MMFAWFFIGILIGAAFMHYAGSINVHELGTRSQLNLCRKEVTYCTAKSRLLTDRLDNRFLEVQDHPEWVYDTLYGQVLVPMSSGSTL
jgi:hypothetical protein